MLFSNHLDITNMYIRVLCYI